MKTFQTLYKKNTQGKIEQWSIEVDVAKSGQSAKIQTTFGERGGKLQTKGDFISEGKNIGKKNETTIAEQALAEAEAKWLKKKKSGYVTSLKDAEAGKTDSIIQGGIVPMLAHSYDDYQDKVEFPCYVQPKLDGQRCIAIRTNGVVTLWTRTRKQITSCPHIEEQVESVLLTKKGDIALDGELYHHDLKDQFEELMSAVRKKEPSEASAQIQFHVYDIIHQPPFGPYEFSERLAELESLPDYYSHVKIVKTDLLYSHKELEFAHDHFVDEGYEGIMVRSCTGLYENKRSKHLLKFKKFMDAEFPILDCIPGKDNSVVFKCKTKTGEVFEATMSGNKKDNQHYLKDRQLWKGEKLTVKFQGLTGKNKVPRFPVGLRIRYKE